MLLPPPLLLVVLVVLPVLRAEADATGGSSPLRRGPRGRWPARVGTGGCISWVTTVISCAGLGPKLRQRR